MRSICSDGAKVGANFEHGAGEKVTIALFCVPLHLGKMERRVILKPGETAIFHDLQKSKETSTMKFKTPLVASGLMLSILTLNAQVQIGAGIVGENFINLSGNSVSMPDANTLAIGAPWNNGNGSEAGHVRAYSWSGTAWVQKGVDIDGEAANDHSGCSVSMPDANTLAIGARDNDGNGLDAGHARVYSWSGTAWVQKGVDIDGEAGGDWSGTSVSMPDANTLAIGAPQNDENGLDAGHARVYSWSGTAWVQKGVDIDGEADGDWSGYSVSMPDANTLAIGALFNYGNGYNAGHVKVYSWSGTAWAQKGVDIDGEAANDHSGCSVSMPDANTLAIGAYGNNGNGIEAGHVRVYSWSGTAWVQKGVDIDGEAGGDLSGHAVSMPDANTLAIGAFRNDGFLPLPDAGHTRVYSWSGTAWGQKGVDINGWSPYNQSGYSVSMPDANILAIGTPAADSGRGHTVVYSLATIGDAENSLLATLKLYPNPASSVINVEVDAEHFDVPYSIYDNTGRIVLKGKLNSELTSIVLGDLSDGVYTISVGEDIRQTFKVNK